jgi:hypothetical protein
VQINEWAWTKIANMIFVEAPVGVGFSYAADGVLPLLPPMKLLLLAHATGIAFLCRQ